MRGEIQGRTNELSRQGLLDTSILVLRRWIDPAELPDEMAISVVTLAELSAGPSQVRSNGEQDLYDEHAERARRTEILQRAESEFDPIPFDAEAARVYGRVTAAVVAAGRKPRRRIADLLIAATAIAEDLPLFTTNPGDYTGLEELVRIVPVTRPDVPHEKKLDTRSSGNGSPASRHAAHVVSAAAGIIGFLDDADQNPAAAQDRPGAGSGRFACWI
jgi:predicted nucleic acid-binding protein